MHHIFTFSRAQYRHQFLILPEVGQRLVGLVDRVVRMACELKEETEWYFSVQGDGNNTDVLRLQNLCLGKGLFFVFDGVCFMTTIVTMNVYSPSLVLFLE